MSYSWDDLRIFLSLVESGSFRATAAAHALSYNTVRTRIARLEDLFGCALLTRGSKGVVPTAQGLELQRVALEMKSASFSLIPGQIRERPAVMNRYVIASTEGLAAVWIVPRLRELLLLNPGLEISVDCSDRREAGGRPSHDFSVQLIKPTDEAFVCSRIGYLHLHPFASHEYIEAHGVPADLAQARKHRWVLQRAEHIPQDVSSAFFGDEVPRDRVALVTNSSSAHFSAIASGLGIGMLPNFSDELSATICPIDIGLSFRREIWLAYRPELNRHKSAKKVLAWLSACFDQSPAGYFGEDSVPAADHSRRIQAARLGHLLSTK